jgi:hypothetical protein
MPAGCARESNTAPPANTPGTCTPTDQDRFVYDPGRLQLVQACVYVTGVVDEQRKNADGDTVILLRLDPPYEYLLTPGNAGPEYHGDIGVEAVCTFAPLEPVVMALCASDANPFAGPFPPVGAHVWMEGRYVLDLHHDKHAELHPLYRAGILPA